MAKKGRERVGVLSVAIRGGQGGLEKVMDRRLNGCVHDCIFVRVRFEGPPLL